MIYDLPAKRADMSGGPGPVMSTSEYPTTATALTPDATTTQVVHTTTPSEAHNASDIPKIGGSSAGFIALVTVLAAIFVICCIGVFLLLRNHNPTPYERRLRRSESRMRGSSLYDVPLGPSRMRARLARWLGGKKGAGWVRASDGDEWDAADEEGASPLGRRAEQKSTPTAPPYIPRQQRDMSAESVELSAADHSEHDASPERAAPIFIPESAQYVDPYSDSPISMESRRTERQSRIEDHNKFSVQSGLSGDREDTRSMRKFHGGTKFKESLD